MNKSIIRAIVMIIIALFLSYGISIANEDVSKQWNGYSVFLISGIIAFLINWIVFIPSYLAQTEKYYDLTGSMTYLSIIIIASILCDVRSNPRGMLVALLVCIWTTRLGSFLFRRILKDGGRDGRFDELKKVFLRFFATWTIQALWVYLTACAALAIITSTNVIPIGSYAILGTFIWVVGFGIEVIADQQKSIFKTNPQNKGKFIQDGLWAYSRHPNYFGEIILWTGIFVIAIPVLEGWSWVAICSPIFVYLLLNYVSGVNLLEAIADKRWGGQPEYEAYKSRTNVLVLGPQKK